MGSFFKSLRKDKLNKSDLKGYFKYAFGEVILLMIGIFFALQINNWKEGRNNKKIEKEIYHEFITTLSKDSIDLALISKTFNKGLFAQEYFIRNTAEFVLKENSIKEIETLILKTLDVSHSFFPRYGIYQQVLNNSQFVIIHSDTIINQLMEVYERRYKLYEHVDKTVETKIQFDLQPVVKGRYQLFSSDESLNPAQVFDAKLFKEHYGDFTYQLRNMNAILKSTQKIIGLMEENIHLSLNLLREEI